MIKHLKPAIGILVAIFYASTVFHYRIPFCLNGLLGIMLGLILGKLL